MNQLQIRLETSDPTMGDINRNIDAILYNDKCSNELLNEKLNNEICQNQHFHKQPRKMILTS